MPIIGDDIKSQVGATITHRVLTTLFRERGVHLDKTMQLNVGGNSDFLNMLERERLESKKISKTNAVTSMLDYDIGAENVHVGPSDYVPWLTDRKWAYIRMEGTAFGDVPLNVELKLEVWDSPNSAGIVIDAVRLAKLALNNGVVGRARGPELVPDEVAAEADRRRRGARRGGAVHRAEPRTKQQGRREGVMPLKRAFLLGAATIVSVAALVAVATVLDGSFGETEGKIFSTLATTFVAGSMLIAGLACLGRRVSPVIAAAGIGLSVVGFLLWSAQIWGGYHSDGYWRLLGILTAWSLAILIMTTTRLMISRPALVNRLYPLDVRWRRPDCARRERHAAARERGRLADLRRSPHPHTAGRGARPDPRAVRGRG